MATLDNTPNGSEKTALDMTPDHVFEAGAAPVVVPVGDALLQADYSRHGGDLQLQTPDGVTILVTGYFNQEVPPDLYTLAGSRITPDVAAKLAGPVAPGQVAQSGDVSTLEEPIGTIDTIKGQVTVIRADGTQGVLQEGAPVYQGDTLISGDGAAIGIIFADKSTLSMAANGRIILDELVYNAETPSASSQVFNVVQGAFMFTSGAIGKADPESVAVNTPVATIGIRGTKFGFSVDAVDGSTDVTVLEGAVFVQNAGGSVLLTAIGETTLISSYEQRPTDPRVLDLQQIQERYGDAIGYHPVRQEVPDAGDDAASVDEETLDEAALDDIADELNDIETAAGESANADAGVTDGEFADLEVGDIGESGLQARATLGETDLTESGPGDAETTPTTADTPVDPATEDEPAEDTEPSVAEEAALQTEAASGTEDTAIPVSITVGELDENDTASITISNIPAGATLSAGTVNDDGSVTLTVAELNGLTVTPPANSDADFTLDISVTTTDTESGDTATVTGSVAVAVIADADAPTLSVSAASGDEDTAISLDIASGLTDTDGSETLTVTVSGIPQGATLSAGSVNQDGSVTLTADELSGLTITPAEDSVADFTLTVAATATDTGGDTATTQTTLPVTVTGTAAEATLTTEGAAGTEDMAIPLSISVGDVESNDTASVTVSNIPAGATLSAGTVNDDGSVTLTVAELDGLTVTPPANSDADFTLDIEVTTTDAESGDTATVTGSVAVAVTADADAPTLSVSAASAAMKIRRSLWTSPPASLTRTAPRR